MIQCRHLAATPDVPDLKNHAGTCRINHPFHPLSGREIVIAAVRQNWGEYRVYYLDERQRLVSVSASWTSLCPPDPAVDAGLGRSVFLVPDLLALAGLIDGFSSEGSA